MYGNQNPFGSTGATNNPFGSGGGAFGSNTSRFARKTPKTTARSGTGASQTGPSSAQSIGQEGKRVTRLSRESISRGTGAQAQPELTVRFTGGGDPTICVLLLSPGLISTQKGATFLTTLELSNPRSTAADALALQLFYDADALEPVSVDIQSLKDLVKELPKVLVDRASGVITAQAAFKSPLFMAQDSLMSIKWKAKQRKPLARIDFGPGTHLTYEGKEILGKSDDPSAVKPGAVVEIEPANDPEQGEDESDYAMLPSDIVAGLTREGSTALKLYGPKRSVRVRQDFYVDLWLDNPHLLPMDKITAHISFDPNQLEVIDSDEDNWIIRDVNILDGLFHKEYPFDQHLMNSAFNALGEIYYSVGLQEARRLPKAGTFARIRFRPKAAGVAEVKFLMASKSVHFPTQVTYLGEDILGKPDSLEDGAYGCSIQVNEK
ncbi:MAG: hypothetical protein NTX50_15065 [Candidatus Sumerlaeota bacterium]|nr:hypothetical protein [Candidatus Sumerlaeota bacterium]